MPKGRPPSVFNSSNEPPILDPRLEPTGTYEKFKREHYDVLCCYKTIIDNVLSHEPIHLTILQKTLRVHFYYPVHLIQKTINFISNYSLRDLEWIERDNVREPLIKLHDPNLSRVAPTGSYSLWHGKIIKD